MTMNVFHRLCCSSNYWAKAVERRMLPWALTDVTLGENTLEIGPGYGANCRVLVDKTPKLTCVEIDPSMTARLQEKYGSRAHIINGDGTATGLPDRLRRAGFTDVQVDTRGGEQRWRAVRA